MSDYPDEVAAMEKRLPKLGGWNHRVIRVTTRDGGEWFGIHEVYYTEDGKPNMYSADPEPIVGDDVESLRWALDRMREALDKPALTPDDFPSPDKPSPADALAAKFPAHD